MSTADPVLSVAGCCLDNVPMPADWDRLAALVIARRVELGHKTRAPLVEASGISLRTLGDIENGRRPSYDPATIAALEQALEWAPGSVTSIVNGGEPTPRAKADTGILGQSSARYAPRDEALIKVMQSNDLSDEQKARIIRELIDDQRRYAERRADELIRQERGERE